MNDVALKTSHSDGRGHCIEYWEGGERKVQHFSWVTNLRVSSRNVYHLRRGGRARWKIANATCKTLKNQGYHFEHNAGHGQQNLSVVFAGVMMLAFLVDQRPQRCCALLRAVWKQVGSKRRLWERMRSWFYPSRLESRREVFAALFYGLEKPRPSLCLDASEPETSVGPSDDPPWSWAPSIQITRDAYAQRAIMAHAILGRPTYDPHGDSNRQQIVLLVSRGEATRLSAGIAGRHAIRSSICLVRTGAVCTGSQTYSL